MEIIAQTDIKQGQEINVRCDDLCSDFLDFTTIILLCRYTTDVLETLQERRENISSSWHFLCSCARCSDMTELGTFSSCLKCHQCHAGVVQLSPDHDQWQCQACHQQYSHSHVDNILNKLKQSLDKIPADNIKKHEAWLTVAARILHPNHCLVVNVKQRLLHLTGTSLDAQSLNRKLELSEHVVNVMSKLDPGITAWRAKILYDITRFKIVNCLQDLQSRKQSSEEVVRNLTICVEDLETGVAGLTGEPFGGHKSGSLKYRLEMLIRAKILGDGYKMLLTTCLKLPFIK